MKKNKFLSLVLVVVLLGAFCLFALGSSESSTVEEGSTVEQAATEIVYETVDLQTMFDALDENAMKAENTYQDKYIEFECKIKSFDSDGSYISVEPVGADEWNFTSATCDIKNDEQRNFLMEKSVGDVINIKGEVTTI